MGETAALRMIQFYVLHYQVEHADIPLPVSMITIEVYFSTKASRQLFARIFHLVPECINFALFHKWVCPRVLKCAKFVAWECQLKIECKKMHNILVKQQSSCFDKIFRPPFKAQNQVLDIILQICGKSNKKLCSKCIYCSQNLKNQTQKIKIKQKSKFGHSQIFRIVHKKLIKN